MRAPFVKRAGRQLIDRILTQGRFRPQSDLRAATSQCLELLEIGAYELSSGRDFRAFQERDWQRLPRAIRKS